MGAPVGHPKLILKDHARNLCLRSLRQAPTDGGAVDRGRPRARSRRVAFLRGVLSSPHSADIGQGRRGKGGAGRLTHPLKLDRCMLKSQRQSLLRTDSAAEEDGFEPSVPPESEWSTSRNNMSPETEGSNPSSSSGESGNPRSLS